MAAALTNASKSVPVYPSVTSINLLISHVESNGFFLVCIANICRLASLYGRGTSIFYQIALDATKLRLLCLVYL